MKVQTLLGAAAVTSLAAMAGAEIELVFDHFTASGQEFFYQSDLGELTGVLDSADGDFMLDEAGEGYTWADDLTVLIATEDMTNILIQLGGYTDQGAANRFGWPYGASGNAGDLGGGYVDIGGIDVTGFYMFLGNGYNSGGDGVWSGVIILNGSIAGVPAPGVLALLGIGGLTVRRRRS